MITNEWLLETAARAAGVLALTAVLVRTVSRSSASLRHLAWAIALAGVIMVPMLSSVMPFRLAVLPAAPIMTVRDEAPPAPVIAAEAGSSARRANVRSSSRAPACRALTSSICAQSPSTR